MNGLERNLLDFIKYSYFSWLYKQKSFERHKKEEKSHERVVKILKEYVKI